MRSVPSGRRPAATLLSVALLSLSAVAMGVMARDLPRQLQLVGAERGAALVAFGTITANREVSMPDMDVPFSALTLRIERTLVGEAGDEVEVWVPGHGTQQLSISPPEDAVRPGARVLVFLRADEGLRALHPGAWKLDSFAEIYRTQQNGKGEVVVLGQGHNSAVPDNVRLSDLEPVVRQTAEALRLAALDEKEEGR
jgi:hypothetical protein